MRTFFSSTFMKEDTLSEARIYHPVKLEYYKIINENEMINYGNAKFGIDIVKKEYKKEGTLVESKKVQYVSDNEKKIEKILSILERNEVTPIALEDVLSDILIEF